MGQRKLRIRKNVAGKLLIILAILLIFAAVCMAVVYMRYHPGTIHQGNNRYSIGNYSIEKLGLSPIDKIIGKAEGMEGKYDIAYFEASVDQKGNVETFKVSVNAYINDEYAGTARLDYSNHQLTYTAPEITTNMLVYEYDENASYAYLNDCFKKIPLKEQIAQAGLERNVVRYQPKTQLEEGTPIYDGRSSTDFAVLSEEEYQAGNAGISDGNTNVVIRLYNGTGLVTGTQYLYVFQPADESTAVGNDFVYMEGDYVINHGIMKVTRNFGKDWINVDITAEQIEESLAFSPDQMSFMPESIFISGDETLPIALLCGTSPKIKLLSRGSSEWKTITLPEPENQMLIEYRKGFTNRAIGFVIPEIGYCALGTDWSMGSGEAKLIYFTHDGGNTWTESAFPLQNSSTTLVDMNMADENTAVVSVMKRGTDAYPTIYLTTDGGTSWEVTEISFAGLGIEIQYLGDIIDFTSENGVFSITFGQENDGTRTATYESSDNGKSWTLSGTGKATVHTVG